MTKQGPNQQNSEKELFCSQKYQWNSSVPGHSPLKLILQVISFNELYSVI